MEVTGVDRPASAQAERNVRWHLLVLLLFAVALGYYERGTMSVSAVMIIDELRLSILALGAVFASFDLASTAGFLLMAIFIWREKVWAGYVVLGILAVLGGLLTGASGGTGGLIVARVIAGLAYGGLLVGAYCMVGGWLPRESHGLATGLLSAVTQSMRLFPALIIGRLMNIGWRRCSQVEAALWFLWVLLWICLLRRSADTFGREQPRSLATLTQIFKDRVVWMVVVGVTLAGPLLSFESARLLRHEVELSKAAGPSAAWEFALLYLLSAMGAVAVGLISDSLIRKGWSAGKSRTDLATICGLLMCCPALFVFSGNPALLLLLAILSVTAGLSFFAVLYAALVDAVPVRSIIVGVGLGGWLSGVMGNVANTMTQSVTSRFGSGPVVIGFTILTLIAVIWVRSLTRTRKIPGELVPA
jgi:MFS family permease